MNDGTEVQIKQNKKEKEEEGAIKSPSLKRVLAQRRAAPTIFTSKDR